MSPDPATDPSPTTMHRHLSLVEPPAAPTPAAPSRHERCGFQECPYPASWSCRSACTSGEHMPIHLCEYHAERKMQAAAGDGRGRCYEHGRLFSPAWLWVRL